jgi:hypothetical protein
MVHVPDEDQAGGPNDEIIPVESTPVEPDSSRRPTAKNPKRKSGEVPRKTTNAVGDAGGSRRRTQMLSLEPPRRNRTNQLSRDGRMDGIGGPSTISQRQRAMMGNIGREKTRQIPKVPPGKTTTKPQLRRGDSGKPIDMGGSNKKVMETMIQRRKTTRIIPKDGELKGDTSPLDSMKSISSPAAPAMPPRTEGRAPGECLPPVVKMPVPQPSIPRQRDRLPTSPGSRGNTLAGVSAEELLGEEGRALLQEMRRREQDALRNPTLNQPHRPGTPLGPRMHDSSLVAFQSAEYATEQAMEEAATDDELEPQGSFLTGPTRIMQREVTQTPMSAEDEYGDQPPPDDLGYERAVDYGDHAADDSEQNPQARESAAQEEMEQRAGYLLWLQGVITFEEVQEALAAEDDVSQGARELLQQGQFTDQETLYRFLARHETLSPVDLDSIQPSERALAALRPAIARSYRVVPLERVGELLLVAAAWPFDPKRLLELRRLTSSKVKLFIVTEDEIDNALSRHYPHASAATLRSPPVSDRTDSGDDVEDITGQGERLEQNYDPTLSGEDSGLYRPISESAYYPATDVGMSEVDESEFDSHAVTGEHLAPPRGANDTDENGALDGVEELDLGGEKKQAQQTGPEDLDPFGE